jgi:hypothetical protein
MRRTVIFVTVLLALLGIIFFAEKREGDMPQNAANDSSLLSSSFLFVEEQSDVVGVKIITTDGILELVRGEYLWTVLQPTGAEVQAGIVEASVSQLRSLPVLAEDLPLSASEIGLRNQAIQVSVLFASGDVFLFEIGASTPSGRGTYIRSENGKVSIIEKDSLDTFLRILQYFGF